MVDDSQNEWVNAFRQKSNYMKTWKPASTPSNRDRLELYALHKQAAQGDAPNTLPSNANASDRAKYNAWRSKSGIAQYEAMRLYCLEADRQVRVYGFSSSSSSGAALGQAPTTNGEHSLLQQQQQNSSNANAGSQQQQQQQLSRGLAAIPLLCAAASESRQAYLRRLAQTTVTHAWWKRQEPLVATPGTIWALPEHMLLSIAALVEYISLVIQQQGNTRNGNTNDDNDNNTTSTTTANVLGILPVAVVQSFLWPTHNSLLALWMGLILISTAWISVMELVQTLFLGSRRTGYSLPGVWKDQVVMSAQSARTLVEAHQPLSARLIGLLLLPLHALIQFAGIVGSGGSGSGSSSSMAATTTAATASHFWSCVLYCAAMFVTWWYWILVVPTILVWWMVVAFFVAGQCFALIELAGV